MGGGGAVLTFGGEWIKIWLEGEPTGEDFFPGGGEMSKFSDSEGGGDLSSSPSY